MATILDVDLRHAFWGNLEDAKRAANAEAANTGGAVVEVTALELGCSTASFIGILPESALDDDAPAPQRTSQFLGAFHTTWGAVLDPSDRLGYLVLRHPIKLRPCLAREDGLCTIAVTMPRAYRTIPATNVGPVCCMKCRRPISPERLRALPNTRRCTECQSQIEEIQHGN